MRATFTAFVGSVVALFFAMAAMIPADTPASTARLVGTDSPSKPKDILPVNAVAQAPLKSPADYLEDLESKTPEEAEEYRTSVVRNRLYNMDDEELADFTKKAKRDFTLATEETNARKPKVAAAPVKASSNDPNCQCAVTGVCTCGPDCPCPCTKEVTAAGNFTEEPQFVTVDEPVYEDRVVVNRGPLGFPRPFLLGHSVQRVQSGIVSRTYATSPITSRIVSAKSVTSPSSVVTTSYPSSSVRVSTPVGSVSTKTYSSVPAGMRKVCVGGRCYLVPQ